MVGSTRFSKLTFVAAFTLISPAFADVDAGLAALDAGDLSGAAAQFQAAYEAGDGDGALYLGRLFEFGVGVEPDPTRAANLYAAASEAGSVDAMNRLGLLYLEGTTLLKDYTLAQKNFCRAADLGDQNGQLNCALLLRDGRGGTKDVDAAMTYLDAAATGGNIAAKNILASMLMDGTDVVKDELRAIALFEETAEEGNAMGLFELAKFYGTQVEGRERDLIAAYSFANLAAVRNMPEALEYRNALELEMSSDDVILAQTRSQEWTAERIAAAAEAEN